MKKILSAIGLAASAGALALAPSASAIPAPPPFDAETVTGISSAQYVHDAPASGYTTASDCELQASLYLDSVTSTPDLQATISHPSSVGCWKASNGRYTYGSLPFTSKNGKMPAGSISTMHAAKPVANIKMHGSGRYATLSQCQSTKDSISDALAKQNGQILFSSSCQLIAPANGSSYYSYGAMTYTSPSYKVTSGDKATNAQWLEVTRYWHGVAYISD